MTIRSALRAALTALAVIPFAAAPSFAFAKPKPKAEEAAAPARKKSVALGVIEGKKNAEVRGWVRDVIQSNFELTDAEDFKVDNDDASIAKMAKDLGVEAVVTGKLEKGRLLLNVRDGATGKQLKQIEVRAPQGPKLKAAVEKKLPKQLYAAFGQLTPAEEAKKKALAKQEAEEAGAEEEGGSAEGGGEESAAAGASEESSAAEGEGEGEKPAEDEKPVEPREATETPLDLRVGVHFSKRDFTFKDTLSQLLPNAAVKVPLRDYHAQLDLSVFLRAEFYPGAMLGAQGMGANIGLAGGFEYGIPSKTVYTPQGGAQVNLKSNAQDWYIGGKIRAPISPTLGLGFFAGYGQQKYALDGDDMAPLVPDVAYNSIRVSADVHATLGKLFVEALLGARLVTSAGDIESKNWFSHAAGRALDARLGLGFQATPLIAVVASGELTRYGLDFNPVPDDATRVAGGAVDQYLGGTLAARLTLPGSPAVTASE